MEAAQEEEEFVEAPPFDLLKVPVVGRFLQRKHARTLLAIPMLLVSVAMILQGLVGPTLAPKNLATVLTWVHFRGALVLALLCAGNLFCLACPFMLVRNAMRRFVKPRFTWPRALRNKWIPVGALRAGALLLRALQPVVVALAHGVGDRRLLCSPCS